MQSDLDAGLDNARHEVEFCYRQLAELETSATALSDPQPAHVTNDDVFDNVFRVLRTKNWNDQFRNGLIRVAVAQAKYIKLLEGRG